MSAAATDHLSFSASQRWNQRLITNTPWLHEEIGRRMLENLAWIKLQPQQCWYWQAQNGSLAILAQLKQRYPHARYYAVEHSARAIANSSKQWQQQQTQRGLKGFMQRFSANEVQWLESTVSQQHKAANNEPQLLWANMCLHAQAASEQLLQQWLQLLQPNGLVMFSCFGPDSFQELRQLYQRNNWAPALQSFTDMHDWGDRLLQIGFTDPVMDMEKILLQYSSAEQLVQELRELGFNLSAQRSTRTRGRAWYQQLLAQLDSQLRHPLSGKLELTVEILYGHALATAPSAKLTAATRVDLATMRQLLKSSNS